ncbi:hypothetical protein OHR68_06850 [Spirillospora sp. NBC_00431]
MMQVDQDRNFSTTISVDRTPQEAFDAVINVRGWWSQEVAGVTDQVGGEFDYHFKDVHRCRMRVTELVPGRKVAWHVLDNYFDFIGGSLRNLINTGEGQPNPVEDESVPAHQHAATVLRTERSPQPTGPADAETISV